VPDDVFDDNLYARLADAVSAGGTSHEDSIRIADSKVLYSSGGSLRRLERGIFATLGVADIFPARWQELLTVLDSKSADACDAIPWYEGYDVVVPLDASMDEITAATSRLKKSLIRAGMGTPSIQSTLVFPQQFNRFVEQYDSKGEVLSRQTLQLVRQMLASTQRQRTRIICDKHGGRKRYGRILQQIFPNDLIEIICEGRAESVYRWGVSSRRVEIRFVTKGESFLLPALASMVSKYLRELAMRAFNAFWVAQVPHLKPTAGYPVDAKRFFQEIEPVQKKLNIDHSILWRQR
jgi:hypothetical protein